MLYLVEGGGCYVLNHPSSKGVTYQDTGCFTKVEIPFAGWYGCTTEPIA